METALVVGLIAAAVSALIAAAAIFFNVRVASSTKLREFKSGVYGHYLRNLTATGGADTPERLAARREVNQAKWMMILYAPESVIDAINILDFDGRAMNEDAWARATLKIAAEMRADVGVKTPLTERSMSKFMLGRDMPSAVEWWRR